MSSNPPAHVDLKIKGAIAQLVLGRPDKLNALTFSALEALDQACSELEAQRAVRVVVLRSTNVKAFCAGADVTQWGNLRPVDMWRRFNRIGHRVFERIAQLPQPTIAAIDGFALGGGLELALACDLRIAGSAARFAMPETTIGAVPGWGGTLRLPAIVGIAQAKRLIFTGMQIDAAEALRIGLAHEVADSAAARAQTLATEIARNAPFAVRLTKQLLDEGRGGVPAETFAAGLAAFMEDGQEGARAFKEKRPPAFSDA